jgi:hypothetical protein
MADIMAFLRGKEMGFLAPAGFWFGFRVPANSISPITQSTVDVISSSLQPHLMLHWDMHTNAIKTCKYG